MASNRPATSRLRRAAALVAAVALAFTAGAAAAERQPHRPSSIVSEQKAQRQDFDWGTLYTYYEGESFGTRGGLAAVAEIKAGREIHPPHRHAEEEYLMVVEGEGTWSLNGREQPARAGDMQYAAPWDVHGISNTGRRPLRFVVWKANSKGVTPPTAPASR